MADGLWLMAYGLGLRAQGSGLMVGYGSWLMVLLLQVGGPSE